MESERDACRLALSSVGVGGAIAVPVVAPLALLDRGDRPLVRWLLPRLLVLLSAEELSSTAPLEAEAKDNAGVSACSNLQPGKLYGAVVGSIK